MAETPYSKRPGAASGSLMAAPPPGHAPAPFFAAGHPAEYAPQYTTMYDLLTRDGSLGALGGEPPRQPAERRVPRPELTDALDDGDVLVPPLRPRFFAAAATQPGAEAAEPAEDSFALRLTKALEAIAAAQPVDEASVAMAPAAGDARMQTEATLPLSGRPAPTMAPAAGDARMQTEATLPLSGRPAPTKVTSTLPRPSSGAPARAGLAAWLATLDRLPPIKLPIGPAVPWRLGLPALLAIGVVMWFVGRPSDAARADARWVRLPAQEMYAVQQDAPLFATSQAAKAQAEAEARTRSQAEVAVEPPVQVPGEPQVQVPVEPQVQVPVEPQVQVPGEAQPTPAAPSVGVPEPAGPGFDFFDIGIKLAAVLGLAYGSLMLLKRAGLGGAAASGTAGPTQGMRVVSTLALAPNRSVHVIKVPGGRALLVGATPTAVNLLADLGELDDADTPEAATFLNLLKQKRN